MLQLQEGRPFCCFTPPQPPLLPPRLRRSETIQNSQIQDASYCRSSRRIRHRIRYVDLGEVWRPLRSGKEVDLEECAILEPTALVRSIGEYVFIFEGEVFDDLRFDLVPISGPWMEFRTMITSKLAMSIRWAGKGDGVTPLVLSGMIQLFESPIRRSP
jgi:hypothetical protein